MTSLSASSPSFKAFHGTKPVNSTVSWLAIFASLMMTALLLRHAMLGDPLAGFDEQFYLMVGDRMWQGVWPYIDIWDRKPLGLFLIYAAIRLLGGDGVWQSQLVATLFAGATAMVIAHMVMKDRAGERTLFAGYASGALYLLFLNVFGGAVGQAPVFYNLFIASAAACIRTVIVSPLAPNAFRRVAMAMMLCGLALTVKTTAIFESLWFGVVPLVVWWQMRLAPGKLAGRATIMLALGVIPFAACALPYVVGGHFDAFWFANAQSAMLRPRTFSLFDRFQLCRTLILMLPLIVIALLSNRVRVSPERAPLRLFTVGWIIAAGMAALSVGIYYEHYAMNMLVPLCVCCGTYFRSKIGVATFAAVILAPLHFALVTLPAKARSNEVSWAALYSAVMPRVKQECMLVYDGPPILYQANHACIVTTHPFPGHFWLQSEAAALGVNQHGELTKALAKRPAVIVTGEMARKPGRDEQADAMVKTVLAAGYAPRRVVETFLFDAAEPITIWQRRDELNHKKL